MKIDERIFKAYDIRGTYPEQINAPMVKRIAQAYAELFKPKTIAVGRDVRTSGQELQQAVIEGLTEMGVNVVDIGLASTDMLYFAVGYYHYDGGIQVSASHNPAEYNGLKMIKAGVEAISSDTGLLTIKELSVSDQQFSADRHGQSATKDIKEDYFDFLSQFAQFESIRPLKIVANNNCGLSGLLAEGLLKRLGVEQIELIGVNFEPNGEFPVPLGRPDPLIPENRAITSQTVREHQANLAVAWDADGDRCYFADENGEFVEGCHLTALLAQHLLKTHPADKIIYDPRNIWATEETVAQAGGQAIMNKAGHTFIKNRMKAEDALFAGEMSGHFYFRDFFYADNGLIPFLIMLNILAETGQPLSEVVRQLREKYFVSGEINFKVGDVQQVLQDIEGKYQEGTLDQTDGLSINYDDWRFNLRASNTEPLLRLNVEARNQETLAAKTQDLLHLLQSYAQ